MKTKEQKLQDIATKYSNVSFNEDNYYVGGGLVGGKFASNRHEDAKEDEGKLTLGNATSLFVKATGCNIDLVKDVIHYSTPNMEWHHAGKLPKAYGGGMKKTYFLNAAEIINIAANWDDLVSKMQLSKQEAATAAEEKKSLEQRRLEFLKKNATYIQRSTSFSKFTPKFYMTEREMNGKYGWFDSSYKDYKLTEYFSGWSFESEEKYNESLSIK